MIEVELPDGRILEIEASDDRAAARAAKAFLDKERGVAAPRGGAASIGFTPSSFMSLPEAEPPPQRLAPDLPLPPQPDPMARQIEEYQGPQAEQTPLSLRGTRISEGIARLGFVPDRGHELLAETARPLQMDSPESFGGQRITYDEATGLERAGDQLRSGWETFKQGLAATRAKSMMEALALADRADGGASPVEAPLWAELSPEQRQGLRDRTERALGSAIQSFITSRADQQEFLRNPNVQALAEAVDSGRYRDAWRILSSDFGGIVQQASVESLPSQIPGLVGALAGGVVARAPGMLTGQFLGGYAADVGPRFVEALSKRMASEGVDGEDGAAVEAWLRGNLGAMREEFQAAQRGGFGPALADTASLGLARGLRPGAGVFRNTMTGLRNMGIEIGFEGLGEAAAGIFAEGKVTPSEVLMEMLGAGPQAAGTTAIATIQEARNMGRTGAQAIEPVPNMTTAGAPSLPPAVEAQPGARPDRGIDRFLGEADFTGLAQPVPPSAGGTGAAAVPPAAPPSGEPSPPPGATLPFGTPPGGAAVPTVTPDNTRPSLEQALNTPAPTPEQQEQQAAQDEAQLEADRASGVQRIAGSLPPGWTVDDEDQIIQVYDPNGMPVMTLVRPPATEQDFAALMTGIAAQNQEGVADGSYPPPNDVPPAPEAPVAPPTQPEAPPSAPVAAALTREEARAIAYDVTNTILARSTPGMDPEDALLAVEHMEASLAKGRTVNVAATEFGQRLDTVQIMAVNAAMRENPQAALATLRAALEARITEVSSAPVAPTQDELVGQSWDAPGGRRVVEGIMQTPQGPRYMVREGDDRTVELLDADQVRRSRQVDEANVKSRADAKKKADEDAAVEAEAKAKREDLDGFDAGLTPIQRGRVLGALSQQVRHNNNRIISRRDLIREKVAAGWRVVVGDDGSRRLEDPVNDAILDQDAITKTGMDYAEHLIRQAEDQPAASQPPAPNVTQAKPYSGTLYHLTDKQFDGVPNASAAEAGQYGPAVYATDAEGVQDWGKGALGGLDPKATRAIEMKVSKGILFPQAKDAAQAIFAATGLPRPNVAVSNISAFDSLLHYLATDREGGRAKVQAALKASGYAGVATRSVHGFEFVIFDRASLSVAPNVTTPAPTPGNPTDSGAGSVTTPAPDVTTPAPASDLEARKAAAKAKFAAAIKASNQRLNAGIDPSVLAAGIELGLIYIEEGVVKFRAWARAVLADAVEMGLDPEAVKPTLKPIYLATSAEVADDVADQMDERAAVRAFDLNALDRPEAPAAAPAAAPARVVAKREPEVTDGDRRATIFTPSGIPIEVTYELRDVSALVVSNDDNGRPNPDYPQELQPRDRTRAASMAQVASMAQGLNPALLGENPSTADGAPVVSPEGVVESGNGRTMALRRAYEEDMPSAQAYRKWLEDQGYDTADMQAPVLVRVRQTKMDDAARAEYTRASNERTTLAMSPVERAAADAQALGSAIERFRGGSVTSAENRPFVVAFMNEAVAKADRAAMMDSDGAITQDGRRRIEAALLHAAYRDGALVAEVFEAGDSDIKAIGGALLDVAGTWALMRREADAGFVAPGVDITQDLLAAVSIVRRARDSGTRIATLIGQASIFEAQASPLTLAVLATMFRDTEYTKPRGREAVATILLDYAEQARKTQPGVNLLGDPEIGGAQILRIINERIKRRDEEARSRKGGGPDLFGGGTDAGDGNAPPGPSGGRPPSGPAGAGSGNGARTQSNEVGGSDVSNTLGNLEPGGGQSAAQSVLAGSDGSPTGGNGGGRGAGGRAGGTLDAGQSGDSGSSVGSPPSGGERGDFGFSDGNPAGSLEGVTTGGNFDERGDLLSLDGVSPGTATGGAVAPSPSGNLSRDQALAAQRAAESLTIEPGIANIRATLPMLLPGQQEDVAKTEDRFAKPDGYGMLFTNGTGTGKTYTGLGVIKRFHRQGKTNILIVVPDEKVGSDWVNSGNNLALKITRLVDTKDAGKGIVVTTYANLGQNDALASRSWDLVVADEAHNLMKSGDASVTNALSALRALTLHPDGALALHDMENRAAVDEVSALAEALKTLRKRVRMLGDRDGKLAARIGEVEAKLDPLTTRLAASYAAVKRRVTESQGAARPRAMFLSATPFAYEKNIEWAQGYLFEYGAEPESGGYNTPSAQQRFMIEHFGYSMKYGKLTEPGALVDRGLMQREFNTWLRREGSLSARSLDVSFDYDRRFILIDSRIGNRVDEALSWLSDKWRSDEKSAHWWGTLQAAIDEQFNYLARMYFLEAIKTEASIPIVQKHLDMGRKVIVFHDFKGGGGFNPFDIDERRFVGSAVGDHADRARLVLGQFRTEFADLVGAAFNNMEAPVQAYRKAFGDKALIVNGDEKQRDNLARYAKFQDDASGPVVLLVQSAKNAGWSGHDATGKHQRVILNLGLPVAPTTAIQQEGRAYRTGQASNAIMRYMNTGTNWEKFAFASKISARASTAENLGMGEDARALKDAFIGAFEASDNFEPGHEGEGMGGKEADRLSNASPTPFGRAKAYYFGQQKKNSRTKSQEGNDYFATPEPLGQRMVAWADARGGNAVLEPSAGHGAIARWFGDNLARTAIEPSNALRARLAMVMSPESDRLLSSTFEDLNIVNKYDVIVMNPPFGVGGKMAIEHLAKAANHLRDGGRIVALIPTGPAADKRFDQWLYAQDDKGRSTNPDLHFVADIRLPTSTFERAGTNVATRIVIIDKQSDKAAAGRIGTTKTVDISDASNVTALFDRIENMEMPPRQLAAPVARNPAPPAYGAPITPPANGVRTPAQNPAGTVERGNEPIIEHTTQSGKVLRGIVRKGITREQARALDPYSFPKDGGFFIREKHLKPPSPATGADDTNDPSSSLYANPFDPALFMRLFGRPAARAVRAAAAGMRKRNVAAVKANWANTRLPDGVVVEQDAQSRDLLPLWSVLQRPSRMFRKWPAVAALVDQGIAAERRMNNWQTRMNGRMELILRTLEKQKGDRAKVAAALFDADANEVDIARKEVADKHFAAHDLSPAEATAARELNALVRMSARLVDNHRRATMPKVRQRKREIWNVMNDIMDRASVKSPEYKKLYARRGRLNAKIRNNIGDLAAHAAEIESINAQLRMMRAADPVIQNRMAELQTEYDALEARLANTSVQRRVGYFPHKFFGSWRMFKIEGVDEETGEPIRTEITSDQGFYDTEEQAVEAARAYLKADPGAKLRIERKVSLLPSGAGGAVLSDAGYSRLRRGLEEQTGIEGQELSDMLSGVARRRSRRRVFAPGMFRTGAEGFSEDIQRVLRTHISQSVRYVEMDKLKFAYVATTERLGLSPSRAQAIKTEGKAELLRALESWWTDVNGNKQQSEAVVDGLLNKLGLPGSTLAAVAAGAAAMGASNPILAAAFGGYLGFRMYNAIRKGGDFPTRTLMGDLTSDMAHLKLGMLVNIASSVVNLSQTLINTYPVLGEKWTAIGIKRALPAMLSQARNRDKPGMMSADAILLRRADVMTDISIQADAAPLLAEDAGLVKGIKRASMAPFMAAEHFNRAVAFMGALARAEAKGLSPAAAFQEAQAVLKKTQFHQGIADRPELLRVTVLKLPTQFKNFMIQQIGFAFDLAGDTFKNPAPVARFLLGLFLAAGIIGILPLALADWMLDYAFGVSPIRWMKDRAIRAGIMGEWSGTMADFLMRGLPTLLQMDLSGRVGMGQGFIPNSPADLMQGPFIGTAARLKDMASNNRREIVDYLAALSPAANPLRMLEAAANGATIDSAKFWSGDNFQDGKSLVRNPQMRGMPEFNMTNRELITQGLGFRNLRQSLVADAREIDRANRKEGRKDANAYLQEMVQAERNGRPERIPEIRQEAAQNGVRIPPQRVRDALRDARRDRPERDLRNAPRDMRPEMRERLRGIDARDLGPAVAR